MKKVTSFGVAMTFVGSMIGAGFASGQELLQFFGGFGLHGFAGIFVSAALYAIYGALIMLLARRMQTDNYNLLIVPGGNRLLLDIVDVFMAFLLFGMFAIMIAGAGSLLDAQFGLTPLLGGVIMVVLSILTVYWGSDSLIASFNIVVPLMTVAALAVSIAAILRAPVVAFSDPTGAIQPNSMVGNWFLSALLFVFYSTLGGVGALPPLALKMKNDRGAALAPVLSAAILGLFAAVVYIAVISHAGTVAGADMPMLSLASEVSPAVGIVYVLVLFAAIYTTAVGALFGIKARVDTIGRLSASRKNMVIIAVAVVALLSTQIGFVNLVSFLYSLYGYMGILIFLGMLVNYNPGKARESRAGKGMILSRGAAAGARGAFRPARPCGCHLSPYAPRSFSKSIFRPPLHRAQRNAPVFPVQLPCLLWDG
ncbi:membrane protein [Agathobaculum sp. TL06]